MKSKSYYLKLENLNLFLIILILLLYYIIIVNIIIH